MIGTFSKGIMEIPNIKSFFGTEKWALNPALSHSASMSHVVGWGKKKSAQKAWEYSCQTGVPFLALEEGFLRSVGLPAHESSPLSIVVDDLGIYYDATRESRLERMLNDGSNGPLSSEKLLSEAREAMRFICEYHLSKYNSAPAIDSGVFCPAISRQRVLVVDQTAGDFSIKYGLADQFSFEDMVEAALAENPEATVYLKLHPVAISKAKKPNLAKYLDDPRVVSLAEDVNPFSVLTHIDKVYVMTSQMGFEALMSGCKVVCFGMPFYAGWGLTDDRVICERRQAKLALEQVFAAAYMMYPRYRTEGLLPGRHPIFSAIDTLVRGRHYNELNRGDLYCFGFSRWKQGFVRQFLKATDNKIYFCKTVSSAVRKGLSAQDKVMVWGAKKPVGLEEMRQKLKFLVFRVEDGFLRSAGLGSDLVRPWSLVFDDVGIYFDAHSPSRLERILTHQNFSSEFLDRAKGVRRRIVESCLSKYNGRSAAKWPEQLCVAGEKEILFVPGQVEADASIVYGGGSVQTNFDLLLQVRQANPSAFIVFKPHPDVQAGNRELGTERFCEHQCDLMVSDVDIATCLEWADEVHTISSTVGFEALLRGKKVVTYGAPFYAGWGLTEDKVLSETPVFCRRQRKLDLDELVAGVLLVYPRYFNWKTGDWCECETVLGCLEAERGAYRGVSWQTQWVRKVRRIFGK